MPLGAFKAALMGTAGVSTGDVVLLSSTTASGASAVSITSGIDSTYGEYIFAFYNINPSEDVGTFGFKASVDGGSNYGVATTTTAFQAYHTEDGSGTALSYVGGDDEAQATGLINLSGGFPSDADSGYVGRMHLFNPSSTTYVKHFYCTTAFFSTDSTPNAVNGYYAGYVNSTSAVNAIQFLPDTGNFDGKIKMWGVK